MKQKTQNTFSNGIIMDLNPLSTPRDVLTDCLNGTIITYNGTEFVLQNDQGNCQVDSTHLSPGFIPLGMKEYGGIVYIASLNPETLVCEIGSFPSPKEDFSTTDFGNIGPANFITANYVVDTGDDTVKQQLDKNLKLFEPELMILSPGDLYIVTYTIIDPNSANDANPDNINNVTKYNNYISQDPNNRKLFRLVFSKIAGNNLVALPYGDITVIPYQSDLSSLYVYYKEPSQAVLTVGLDLETLDTFNASVEDISLNVDSNKKVSIVASGDSDSLATFNGIRVQVTQPSTQTFYLNANTVNTQVSAIIDGLTQNQQFQCNITPYSPYQLYPNLTKTFNLTLGQYLSAGSGVNNIFTYYIDLLNNNVTVNFDYKFQGNSHNGLYLYVEFYDPWSDYSVVKAVDNPTYFGINTIILPLVNEPKIDQYDSTTVGGTNPNLLITNPDTDFAKTLLNSTNLIRSNQSLRLNHFYIVRISGVDKTYNTSTSLYVYTHYDLYKGMYTTDMFNSIYTSQVALSVNSPSYISDFNSLNFVVSNLNYTTTILPNTNTNIAPVVTTQRSDLTTNGNYYKISPTALSTTTGYKYTQTYENQSTYTVDLTLQGLQYVFGNFKTNLLTITPPTLVTSNSGSSGQKPTIVDNNYDGNSNISCNSVANWTITNTSGTNYALFNDTVTSRSVYAPVATGVTTTGYQYAEVALAPSFYYRPNNDGIFVGVGLGGAPTSPKATILIQKQQLQCMNNDSSAYVYSLSGAHPFDGNVSTAINNSVNTNSHGNDGRTYSALLMTSGESDWWYTNSPNGTPWACTRTGNVPWKYETLLMKMADGTYRLTKVLDIAAMVEFFSMLFVASNVSSSMYVYYPITPVYNLDIQTVVTYPNIIFTTNFTPNSVSGSYVTTYLSTFRLHATGALIDFSATNINNYIASRQGSSTIVDSANVLRDGFIPFINTLQTTTGSVIVPPLTIDEAANSNILTQFGAGAGLYNSDPILKNGPKPHGTLFSTNNVFNTSYVPLLEVQNTSGTIVNTGPSAAYVQVKNGTSIWATGTFPPAGRCIKGNAAPSLIPSIDFTFQ
jgi:hypothetical protein